MDSKEKYTIFYLILLLLDILIIFLVAQTLPLPSNSFSYLKDQNMELNTENDEGFINSVRNCFLTALLNNGIHIL